MNNKYVSRDWMIVFFLLRVLLFIPFGLILIPTITVVRYAYSEKAAIALISLFRFSVQNPFNPIRRTAMGARLDYEVLSEQSCRRSLPEGKGRRFGPDIYNSYQYLCQTWIRLNSNLTAVYKELLSDARFLSHTVGYKTPAKCSGRHLFDVFPYIRSFSYPV